MFMLTADGKPQFWQVGERCGLLLTETRKDARTVRDWLEKNSDIACSPVEVGRIPQETLQLHLDESLTRGANCAFIFSSIEGDSLKCELLEPPRDKEESGEGDGGG